MGIDETPIASGFRRTVTELELIPFPAEMHLRGAPFRTAPGLNLHISTEALPGIRQRAQIIADQLTQLGIRTHLGASSALDVAQALLTPAPSVSKQFDQLGKTFRKSVVAQEGYRLVVNSDGIFWHALEESGFFYAGQTVRQLHEDRKDIPSMEVEDAPRLRYRALHLDFRGWPPPLAYLQETVDQIAKLKMNVLILDYGSHFDFLSQPGVAGPAALSSGDISELEIFARDRGVMLIPLLHCIGNQEYLLKLEPYRELREDTRYLQQFCPCHPSTVEIFSAMAEDLLATHTAPFFHIGGDACRFLGVCPTCQARAKQVGGRSSLLLEFFGKICAYLESRGKSVMIWNERFARMTDEQLRWLPESCLFGFKNFGAVDEDGKKMNWLEVQRYQALNRKIWAATPRSLSLGDQVYSCIDQSVDAAEAGMLEGMILSSECREHTSGALSEPNEITWPPVYYFAERAWAGRQVPTREELTGRVSARMFGVADEDAKAQARGMYELLARDFPREARRYLRRVYESGTMNKKMLVFIDSWCRVQTFLDYVRRFEDAIAAEKDLLDNGDGDPFYFGRLRWRVEDLKSRAPEIIKSFRTSAVRISTQDSFEEFLNGKFVYALEKLDRFEELLSTYPLPDEAWQQPVHV